MQTTNVFGTFLAALVAQQGVHASPLATQGALPSSSVGLAPDMVKWPEPINAIPTQLPSSQPKFTYPPPGLYPEHTIPDLDLTTDEGASNSVVGRGERRLNAYHAHPRRDTTPTTAVGVVPTTFTDPDLLDLPWGHVNPAHRVDECPPHVACARSPKGGLPGTILDIVGQLVNHLDGGSDDSTSTSSKRAPKGGLPGTLIDIFGNLISSLDGGDDASASTSTSTTSKRAPKGGLPGTLLSIFGNLVSSLDGGDDASASTSTSSKRFIINDNPFVNSFNSEKWNSSSLLLNDVQEA
ncbi:hypothetical protein M406DRAFT_352497 [Cryphonectria parasitica EP155]|uniref:Uncharacterized protein n=1 Tax=Cryphonectria parasitica (strain ATCC 38755 / EP155) TaxID=660469 RepID=A0A9P5CN04_CRYP1|nr:uncharacterized protein M406DRAFT_352497 [Cryphonectria parasitica EP155]KAF3763802.1 hypothetical protein M406DRAFT_352497 [Cryphonectria parasitica EP155]